MSKMSLNFRKVAMVAGMFACVAGVFYVPEIVDTAIEASENKAKEAELAENGGKAPQATAEFIVTDNDRRYTIWDGMVVEELTNNTPYVYTKGSLGKRAYDFDLRSITYMSDNLDGGMDVKQFSESMVNGKESPHIEHVRKLGCLVADGYFARAAAGTHQAPPANVAGFRARHCVPGG